MTIKDFYNWAFICGDWQIAYRKRTDKSDFYEDSFIKIPNTDRYWFADPMLFADNGNTYLFVEAFDKKTYKGNIGFFTIQNNKVSDFELLIDNNFHMSYPMVWRSEQNEYFMIPESEENGTVDLYQSEAFPRRWKRLKTLVAGVHYADTTLLDLNGKKYLFTYHDKKVSWDLLIYDFDAKYNSAESKTVIDPDLPPQIKETIRANAIAVFKAVSGFGLSRVDFFVEKDTNEVIFNEINTLPGFTSISMYPMLWKAMGVETTELITELIELAGQRGKR